MPVTVQIDTTLWEHLFTA